MKNPKIHVVCWGPSTSAFLNSGFPLNSWARHRIFPYQRADKAKLCLILVQYMDLPTFFFLGQRQQRTVRMNLCHARTTQTACELWESLKRFHIWVLVSCANQFCIHLWSPHRTQEWDICGVKPFAKCSQHYSLLRSVWLDSRSLERFAK